jgi:hypothetical protein
MWTWLFVYMLNLAGTPVCPRARNARGLRARAWFSARGGWRARARARDLGGGCGRRKLVSAGTMPVAIFTPACLCLELQLPSSSCNQGAETHHASHMSRKD